MTTATQIEKSDAMAREPVSPETLRGELWRRARNELALARNRKCFKRAARAADFLDQVAADFAQEVTRLRGRVAELERAAAVDRERLREEQALRGASSECGRVGGTRRN